jgi:uncharacterized protein (DUF1697 family)
MTTRIALLRAINVAGHQKIAMSDLRGFLEDLGYGDVRSVLQTGNLIFTVESSSTAALERHLEAESEKRLGLGTEFFVRSDRQWSRVIADNPFPAEAERDPSRLLVQFLKKTPVAGGVEALQAAIRGPEILRSVGKQLYVVFPDGVGDSKLTTKIIERKLGVVGTGRNWNTVLKIGKLASD